MRTLAVSASSLLFLVACGGDQVLAPTVPTEEGSRPPILRMPEEEAPITLEARLAQGIELSLLPGDSGFSLSVARGQEAPTETKPIGLLDGLGRLSIDSEGRVSLAGFEVSLDDIVISAETFPPHGLHVVDVVAKLELDVVDSDVSLDRSFASFTAEAHLGVSWSLLDRFGQRVKLRPIDAHAEVGGLYQTNAEGDAELELMGVVPGSLLLVADMFALSDVSFSLRLAE